MLIISPTTEHAEWFRNIVSGKIGNQTWQSIVLSELVKYGFHQIAPIPILRIVGDYVGEARVF